jgi:predicted branched-subunit amino acid permease
MNDWRQLIRHPEYRRGLTDMIVIAPGLASWGLMTGVAMINSGMSLLEAISMTLLVYAGSSQLAAIPLIATGAPASVILATAFCVNLRFVVFSAHMRAYLMHLPLRAKLFIGYLTADTSYVMFTRRFHQPPANMAEQQAQLAYLLGGCTTNWSSWQLASLLGIALAHSVPPQWGLGFAGILALLGVACSLVSTRLRLVSAGVAGAAAVAAFALPFKLNIVVAIAAAVAVVLLLEKTALNKEAA